jgi:hypothetical protein
LTEAAPIVNMSRCLPTALATLAQFIIHLHAQLNSQWPVRESTRIQTTEIEQHKENTKKKTKKIDQSRLFTFKREIVKYL